MGDQDGGPAYLPGWPAHVDVVACRENPEADDDYPSPRRPYLIECRVWEHSGLVLPDDSLLLKSHEPLEAGHKYFVWYEYTGRFADFDGIRTHCGYLLLDPMPMRQHKGRWYVKGIDY